MEEPNLQTILDLQELFQNWFLALQKQLPFVWMLFECPEQQISLKLGEQKPLSTAIYHDFLWDNVSLGHIYLYWQRAINPEEFLILEHSFKKIQIPLHNALEYYRVTVHSFKDALTNVGNRFALEQILKKKLTSVVHQKDLLSLIFIDVVHFKHINDTYGHLAGDHALKFLAQNLQLLSRDSDTIFRYGGDEFLCILNTNKSGAQKMVDRIHDFLKKNPCHFEEQPFFIQVSIGIAEAKAKDTPHCLLERVDQDFYHNKRKKTVV